MSDGPRRYGFGFSAYLYILIVYGAMVGTCLYLKPFEENVHYVYLFGPLALFLGAGALWSRRVGYTLDDEGITVQGYLSGRRFRWVELKSIEEKRVSRGVMGVLIRDTRGRKVIRITDWVADYAGLKEEIRGRLREASGERRGKRKGNRG
jgi:hypothetical protein